MLERNYSSAFADRDGPLGHGWSISLDQAVWRERGKVVLLAEDGREVEFDTFNFPRHSVAAGQEVYNPIERLTLRCLADERWVIVDHEGRQREFAPVPGRRDGRAMIQRMRSRCTYHEIQYFYDQRGQLEWVRDSGDRVIRLAHDARGRLVELHLPHPEAEGLLGDVSRAAADSDLVQANKWAKGKREVLIIGHIPADAIVEVKDHRPTSGCTPSSSRKTAANEPSRRRNNTSPGVGISCSGSPAGWREADILTRPTALSMAPATA